MITLPDFSKAFEYENNFYLSCQNNRLGKFLAHYELFKMVQSLSGSIVECGVFKGVSFVRFAALRQLFGNPSTQKLVGFDIFGAFPLTDFEDDKKVREEFIKEAGEQSISKEQLFNVMRNKGIEQNTELIAGNILETVPVYLNDNPDFKIALLNLDTDVYEPAVTILNNFWPKIISGGILILDDYGVFPGETKAVDDYFKDKQVKILKFPFAKTPCYIIKK